MRRKLIGVGILIASLALFLVVLKDASAGYAFNGYWHLEEDGQIYLAGKLTDTYHTEPDVTAKGHRLYYGDTTDKEYRIGYIRYTATNKAVIIMTFYDEGKLTYRIRQKQNGSITGTFKGWYRGEDEKIYRVRGDIYGERIR